MLGQQIHRIGRLLVVATVVGFSGACTEKLTTVGDCPALCPGGNTVYRDTVITATIGGDTTYAGYGTFRTATSLLLSNGGVYGQSRGIIHYYSRGDSVQVDSLRPWTSIDSIFIELVPQSWDDAVGDKLVDVYRLPYTTDTTATVAGIDALMTPDRLLGTLTVSGASTPTPMYMLFTGDDLAKFTFEPADRTQLVIGLRLRSGTPTAMRMGSSTSGSAAPSWTTWGTVTVADTLQRVSIQRTVLEDFSSVVAPPVDETLLRVGGDPAARSFIHFALPPALRDSAIIVRATLLMDLAATVPGIPGDSITLAVENLIGDFGPKSPVLGSSAVVGQVKTGQPAGLTAFEVVSLVRFWQGSVPLPSAIRISTPSEAASFTLPSFLSSRSSQGMPRIRITYRSRYGYGGF